MKPVNSFLESIGLRIIEVPKDNYCMYHAITAWLNHQRPTVTIEQSTIAGLQARISNGNIEMSILFEYFAERAGTLLSLHGDNETYLRMARLFEEEPGEAMWANEDIVRYLIIPLINRSIIIIDTQNPSENSTYRGELYGPDGTITLLNTEDQLMRAITDDPEAVIFLHSSNHWELILGDGLTVEGRNETTAPSIESDLTPGFNTLTLQDSCATPKSQ